VKVLISSIISIIYKKILSSIGINTCTMRDKYFCNDLLESMSSWISFERENYVENVRGFRFAKFLINREKCERD